MKVRNLGELLAVTIVFLSLGVLFALIADETGLTGHVVATVNITPPIPAPCNVSFTTGWNAFSIWCITTYDTLEDFYPRHMDNLSFSTIYAYRSIDSNDPWKVNNPELPSWVVQDLTYLDRRDGYWAYWPYNDSSFFIENSSKRIPTVISLKQGWNYVGYVSNNSIDIESGISSINGSYDHLLWYNNTQGQYYGYAYGGNLSELVPYQAYWVYMDSIDNFEVNW